MPSFEVLVSREAREARTALIEDEWHRRIQWSHDSDGTVLARVAPPTLQSEKVGVEIGVSRRISNERVRELFERAECHVPQVDQLARNYLEAIGEYGVDGWQADV